MSSFSTAEMSNVSSDFIEGESIFDELESFESGTESDEKVAEVKDKLLHFGNRAFSQIIEVQNENVKLKEVNEQLLQKVEKLYNDLDAADFAQKESAELIYQLKNILSVAKI